MNEPGLSQKALHFYYGFVTGTVFLRLTSVCLKVLSLFYLLCLPAISFFLSKVGFFMEFCLLLLVNVKEQKCKFCLGAIKAI